MSLDALEHQEVGVALYLARPLREYIHTAPHHGKCHFLAGMYSHHRDEGVLPKAVGLGDTAVHFFTKLPPLSHCPGHPPSVGCELHGAVTVVFPVPGSVLSRLKLVERTTE